MLITRNGYALLITRNGCTMQTTGQDCTKKTAGIALQSAQGLYMYTRHVYIKLSIRKSYTDTAYVHTARKGFLQPNTGKNGMHQAESFGEMLNSTSLSQVQNFG
jgi:hypothetical protein